jgi:predicted short-subunit dehydrogenase-like oxidoreductase (DUF2520 family)
VSQVGHVLIVGPGRAGTALGYALVQADAVTSLTVCGRRPEPPTHPLFVQGLARYVFGLARPEPETAAVFLAVPDDVVPELAYALAGQGAPPEGCAAFHLSGALSTDILAPLHARGYEIGSFHPLQAIAHPVTAAERIPGSYVAVTGTPGAVAVARRLTAALGSPVVTVPETRRPLYHAAAVMASNFLPPLLDAACRLLERAGVPHEEALPALLPLVRGTLANIEEVGLDGAVTGPIPRGDVETVGLHLRALDAEDRRLYALLGRQLVRLAGARLDEDARREILEHLENVT